MEVQEKSSVNSSKDSKNNCNFITKLKEKH